MTALMQAVTHNDLARVRQLIHDGVDVNARDAHQDVPLIIAAYLGYTTIVQALLDAGADVTALDPEMHATALHAAAYAGHTDAAALLIAHGIELDKQGPYNGYTALHDAIWQNHIATAQLLIDAGADLQLRSHAGETPLAFAQAQGRTEIAALIAQQLAAGRP